MTTPTRLQEIEAREKAATALVARLRELSQPPYDSAIFGGPMSRAANEIEHLLTTLRASEATVEKMREALKGLLLHAGIADAAAEDIDEEDHARERAARTVLKETP